jgi:pimeloyl-ACP methyl ester carboxylesterase
MGTITVPTLIIRGERDDLLVQQDQEALSVAIPGSRLVLYNDTDHLVLWEQPQRVASDLINFVTSLSA